jgi:RNA polymerase sigma factor FliA
MDTAGRQQVVLQHLTEVKTIARGIHRRIPSHVPFDDLFHAGVLGLIDAVDKFDTRKNVQFRSYAQFRIRGAIIDSLREMDWAPRNLRRAARRVDHVSRELESSLSESPSTSQVASKLCMNPEDLHILLGEIRGLRLECLEIGQDKAIGEKCLPAAFRIEEDPFQTTFRKEIHHLLEVALLKLDEKEGEVLYLYYFEELKMAKIGLMLGIGESRVSQIHAAGLLHLRLRFMSFHPGVPREMPSTRLRSVQCGLKNTKQYESLRLKRCRPYLERLEPGIQTTFSGLVATTRAWP